jgi:alginate O-acetyltransferase complex protein AlgI
MNFTDFTFWELLLPGCILWIIVRQAIPRKIHGTGTFDKIALLSLDLALIANVGLPTFLTFLTVSIGTYLWLCMITRFSRLKWTAPALFAFQLLPLFYFKYSSFFLNSVCHLQIPTIKDLLIPAGLSFYTFQKVAFAVDTLHNELPLPKPLDYLNFAGFFAQIVAGPIERRADLLPQMENFRLRWDLRRINKGLSLIVLGFFFKACLADNLAPLVVALRANFENVYLIWATNICFGFQIYFDFAGYSFIALGLGKVLGIELTLNFRSPYLSTSIQEFWRRWHVTLSRWFRDYLYIPLGGGRTRFWFLNILIVFVVSGIWHGAGWNFIVWGFIHGMALALERILKFSKIHAFFGWMSTSLIVFFAWMFFYETNGEMLAKKVSHLFTLKAYALKNWNAACEVLATTQSGLVFVMLGLCLFVLLLELFDRSEDGPTYSPFFRIEFQALMLVLTFFFAPVKSNGFIYFSF